MCKPNDNSLAKDFLPTSPELCLVSFSILSHKFSFRFSETGYVNFVKRGVPRSPNQKH